MKLFIWDFHGVLEKDNEYAVKEVCDKVLSHFGVKRKATLQECLDLYGKKWADYFKYLIGYDDERIVQMVDFAVEISITEKPALKYIKPMDHSHNVLDAINKKGHVNLIISNSSPEALEFFLQSVNIQDKFTYKYGADRNRENAHEENSKEVWLRNFLQKNDFDDIIVIDDLPQGIDMGNRLGAITYHFCVNRKVTADADHSISDLREVLREL